MAQKLEPNRSDNRGGNKPVSSTKRHFIWRIERSKYDELKAYAIKLNKEAEQESEKRYTFYWRRKEGNGCWKNLHYSLTDVEAKSTFLEFTEIYPFNEYKIEEIQPLPCNTTEK